MAKMHEKLHKRKSGGYVEASFNVAVDNTNTEVSIWFTDKKNRHLWIKLDSAEALELGRLLTVLGTKKK